MSAFDALTKIKQAVTHPKTDHLLPKSRSLAFKAITEKAALQGTKGDHCELVHGDHWKELKGNEVSNVKLDQKLTVSRHQTIKVVGNHKETIVGKVYQNIIGPHIVQNNAVRNETRLGRHTLMYGHYETSSDDNGDSVFEDYHIEVVGNATASHNSDTFTCHNATTYIVETSVAFFGILNFELASINLGIPLIDIAVPIVHGELVGMSGELHGLHGEIHVVHHEWHPPHAAE